MQSEICFEVSREIAAPVHAVWLVIADYARDHEWREGVHMRQEPPGLARAGAITHEQLRMLGSVHRVSARLEEVIDQRRIVFRTIESDVPVHGVRALEPTRDGVRVTVRITMSPRGAWRLVARPMAAMLRRRFERDLARLASLVEAPGLRASA